MSDHAFAALVFDMDGTLTRPALNFMDIRAELGLPPGEDLVRQIDALGPREQRAAWAVIEAHEEEAS